MDTNETQDAARLREAMGRAVGDLEAAPTLLPTALVLGPRRRARVLMAKAGGAVAATAAVVALVAVAAGPRLTGQDGTDVAADPPPVASPPGSEPVETRTSTPSPTDATPDSSATSPGGAVPRYPVVPGVAGEPGEPGAPGAPGGAAMPPAERARVDEYRQRAAHALELALPTEVGAIQIVQSPVSAYQGRTQDGLTFPLVFSVRARSGDQGAEESAVTCLPDEAADACRVDTLPGGESVALRGLTAEARRTGGASATFRVGGSEVLLAARPDAATGTPSPVGPDELLRLAAAPLATELFQEADAAPLDVVPE
ncbi:hypothetical protein [Streptomyces avicenniae]|uniref:hypothetical protein n=1 Tax=Streptomyces avicenniae TaxID=500153 RepID=UPI00069AA6BA|nr:hypothetical protein [Streptomyces avicenniae]